jgi:2-amino-4-hydroxy-6-hydroxymethyldihydropteridine diphosphokinase
MSANHGLKAQRVFIGLGSNLAEPAAQVERAIAALAALPQSRLLRQSRLYASPPLGPVDQPDYVNAVVELDTTLAPRTLLSALHDIEQKQGRIRTRHWGERVIDLDLLLYADLQINNATLQLPHPGIAARAFVLRPLAELVPSLMIPGQGALRDLLAARAADVCEPL